MSTNDGMRTNSGHRNRREAEVLGPSIPSPISLREPLLDAEEAAELLHVRVSWVREATRNGSLPCLRLGRNVRYTRSLLEAWLGENRVHR